MALSIDYQQAFHIELGIGKPERMAVRAYLLPIRHLDLLVEWIICDSSKSPGPRELKYIGSAESLLGCARQVNLSNLVGCSSRAAMRKRNVRLEH